jgi:hypothetical protein
LSIAPRLYLAPPADVCDDIVNLIEAEAGFAVDLRFSKEY